VIPRKRVGFIETNPTSETGTSTITRVAGSAEAAINRNVAAFAERNDHVLRTHIGFVSDVRGAPSARLT
jgi:hypothetical protein